MSDDHEIVVAEPAPIRQDERLHPMVQAVIAQGASVEQLRDLMQLQREHEAHIARQAFSDARRRLLDDLPPLVAPDRRVDIRGGAKYRYASLPQVMTAVTPALRRHGFSVSWRTDTDNRDIVVTCVLSYGGHDETCTRQSPPDSKGAKSPVQASQSTVTYLQRHTLLALLGVVTGDAPDADDRTPTDPDAIDPQLTLRAITGLRRLGIAIEDAEEHLGRPTSEWTVGDYETIRAWAKERKQ